MAEEEGGANTCVYTRTNTCQQNGLFGKRPAFKRECTKAGLLM